MGQEGQVTQIEEGEAAMLKRLEAMPRRDSAGLTSTWKDPKSRKVSFSTAAHALPAFFRFAHALAQLFFRFAQALATFVFPLRASARSVACYPAVFHVEHLHREALEQFSARWINACDQRLHIERIQTGETAG
jgi:hypothetical protein